MTSHEPSRNTYFTSFSAKSLILQHLREVVPNASSLAFARLAFVFIDHLLVPAPLPTQRRITRRASRRNRNQVRHTDDAIAVHFDILGHALRHLSVCLQVVHVTCKFGERVYDVCGFFRLKREFWIVCEFCELGCHLCTHVCTASLYTRLVKSCTKASPMSWLRGLNIILYHWHVYIKLSSLNVCIECSMP